MSRLTSATTPESGTTNFYYTLPTGWPYCSTDLNAVCRRTDARGITTTYWYDPLRLGAKIYSDATPTANFYYDEPNHNFAGNLRTLNNTKGRLSRTLSGSAETVYSYDPAGRVTDHWSCPIGCGAQFYPSINYGYDLAGDVTGWANLFGHSLTYTVNTAQQATQVRSNWAGITMPDATFTYTPFGAINTFVNGCIGAGCPPGQETNDYNSRLQAVRIQVGTAATPNANSCLVYNYYSSVANPTGCAIPGQGTGNNGTVVGYFYQDNSNPSLSHTAAYAYDSLNRLATSVATGSAMHNLTFSYDRWGNMSCVTNAQTNGLCPNWTFNTTSNRISTAGFTYDAAGNLTSDGLHTYQWDAEARLKSVDNGATATYYYNALGQRVQKQPGSGLPADYRYYFYDAFGQFVDMQSQTAQLDHFYPALAGRLWGEYAGYFFHPNPLGSTGMVMNAYGLFGQYGVLTDELYYPWGQRWQLVGSSWWERFASLERRDQDTSLDPTLFRTYASTQGRWMTPDPLAGDISNPQSLNRYAYVLNNPTNLIDPLGLEGCSFAPNYPGCIGVTSFAGPGFSLSTIFCFLGFGGCGGLNQVQSFPTFTPPTDTSDTGGGTTGPETTPAPTNQAPPNIVITNPSQTGPKQKAIADVINKLINVLPCDAECLAFLTMRGIDPIATLTAISSGNFAHADITENGDPSRIGAISPDTGAPAVIVNNAGAFFQSSAPGGGNFTVGPAAIPGGTPRAQAFILLHELGHNTHVLRPDAGVPKNGRKNDQDIRRHCKKTIKSF